MTKGNQDSNDWVYEPVTARNADGSNKTDKKFTAHTSSEARRGFVFNSTFVFEKQ